MLAAQETFSPREAARYCHVGFRTVIRWIERDELAAYRLPGRGYYRIAAVELLRFMQKHQFPLPLAFRPILHRVLIVEDEIRLARSMRRVLERGGFDVRIATTAFEAGYHLATFRPAVMTLDLKLPHLPGKELLEVSRETHSLDGVHVLVVSGAGDDAIADALERGADDFLEKPFANEALLEKIRGFVPPFDLLAEPVPRPAA